MRWSTTESSTLTLALRWPRRSSKERDGIIVDHETLRFYSWENQADRLLRVFEAAITRT